MKRTGITDYSKGSASEAIVKGIAKRAGITEEKAFRYYMGFINALSTLRIGQEDVFEYKGSRFGVRRKSKTKFVIYEV